MTDNNNHVFPRPPSCRDPSRTELLAAADNLMHGARNWSQLIARSAELLCEAFHGDAVAAGWHHNIATGEPKWRNPGEMLMLAVSELAEAMEGHRKNLMDDKLPHRPMIEVELADYVIRVCDTICTDAFTAGGVGRIAAPGEVPPYFGLRGAHTPPNVGDYLLYITTVTTAAGALADYSEGVRALTPEGHNQRTKNSHAARALLTGGMMMAFHLAASLSLDLPAALVEKRHINKTRTDHSVKARLAEGGKAY